MSKARKDFKRFLLRLKIAYRLVFKEKHGVVIYITGKQLEQLISNSAMEGNFNFSYFSMMEHQACQTIKIAAACIDDVEIYCSKAEFEAKFLKDL